MAIDVKDKLKERKILIVEDDEICARRLKKEFEHHGSEVNIKHTVESGLKKLKKDGLDYDLIIVDVMLPATENDYNKIEEIRKKIDECHEILGSAGEAIPGSAEFNEIEKAREDRNYLIELISPLIHKMGGIEMIKKWVSTQKEKQPPILYLSALKDITTKQNGIEAAKVKIVDWISKPVTSDKLMEKAVNLISQADIG